MYLLLYCLYLQLECKFQEDKKFSTWFISVCPVYNIDWCLEYYEHWNICEGNGKINDVTLLFVTTNSVSLHGWHVIPGISEVKLGSLSTFLNHSGLMHV